MLAECGDGKTQYPVDKHLIYVNNKSDRKCIYWSVLNNKLQQSVSQ